jgi:hypothetical protein
VVAHALQVARHLDRAHEEAQVARHRLLQREQLHGRALDLQLERVQLRVAGDHGRGGVGVALQQRRDGQLHQRLGALAHEQESRLEVGELLVEVAVAAEADAPGAAPPGTAQRVRQPNLPVM